MASVSEATSPRATMSFDLTLFMENDDSAARWRCPIGTADPASSLPSRRFQFARESGAFRHATSFDDRAKGGRGSVEAEPIEIHAALNR